MRLCLFSLIVMGMTNLNAYGAELSRLSKTELKQKLNRLEQVTLTADISKLSQNDQMALRKIILASKYMDDIFLRQVWEQNPTLKSKLQKDDPSLLALFNRNTGPWLRLDHDQVFVKTAPDKKPTGAGFYPEDITKEEFEKWIKTLSKKEKETALGYFTLIRRNKKGELIQVPYTFAYRQYLEPSAKLLEEAAKLTSNQTLKKYLNLRAKAFLSSDYYDSDVAWMELDAPIDVTIGPYETYEDGLFNYKAAFESFVGIRDDQSSKSLEKFSEELQHIENSLPLEAKYKNPKIGALAPIRVLDLVYTSGEARSGVATAAFNLPNDERVVKEKGSKRVMLKNVQQAKFDKVLTPIAGIALNASQKDRLSFDAFFIHILMHELVHGLGPGSIEVDGEKTTVRHQLKELYSAIEEAKADITGLFAMKLLVAKGVISKEVASTMYTTFLASAFRSVRFGIDEAHGRGQALQFNYLWDEGAISFDKKSGTFSVVEAKFPKAVEKLAGVILTLQAEGSYAKANALLSQYAVIRPEMKKILEKTSHIPIDIWPNYPMSTGLGE